MVKRIEELEAIAETINTLSEGMESGESHTVGDISEYPLLANDEWALDEVNGLLNGAMLVSEFGMLFLEKL